MMFDYVIHFGLEATGSLIAIFAYASHRCVHWWHKAAIWTVLTAATTFVTVQLVG